MTAQRGLESPKSKIAGAGNTRQTAPKETVTSDSDVSGLGERIRGDSHTWIVQMRVDGKSRKRTLGNVASMDRGMARDLARAQIEGFSEAAITPLETPTLAVYAQRFLAATFRQGLIQFTRHAQP